VASTSPISVRLKTINYPLHLVMYIDGELEIDANIADLFGADEGEQQKQCEVDAQVICTALDGIVREQQGSK
jgi:hypothetical protein